MTNEIIKGKLGFGKFEKFTLEATDTKHITKDFEKAIIKWIKFNAKQHEKEIVNAEFQVIVSGFIKKT